MSGAPATVEDLAYFQAIEETFVRLRGAPLLLSPKDFLVAERWHREGVPLELVRQTLEDLFAERRERGLERKISSLRYCAPRIDKAWKAAQEMSGVAERSAPPIFDVPARLAALARALPLEVPAASEIAPRVVTLGGGTEEVERALAVLDGELIEAALAGLSNELAARVQATVAKSTEKLAKRLDAQDIEAARDRLRRQAVRRELKLPLLSLFSPEAES